MTDAQFKTAFTAAGGWFIVTQFETVYLWRGTREELGDQLYRQGFDNDRTGTSARTSALLRIIKEGRAREALVRIRDSDKINRDHPEAKKMASDLISRYCPD